MSKAPDLSAFPIPRKGGAKPIIGDETTEASGQGRDPSSPAAPAAEGTVPPSGPQPEPQPDAISAPRATAVSGNWAPAPRSVRPAAAARAPGPPPPSYGQTVATTVKLDENRYLRLMEAGKPGPGRLRRRTIQDMLIEALDEWFERRQF